MDSEVTNGVSPSDEAETPAPANTARPSAEEQPAESSLAPRPEPPAPLDLNKLQDYSGSQLHSLASELDLRLYSARSRHQHILDLVRASLGRGGVITTEGFLEQGESIAFLRLPKLNFLAVPEDVCVPRALIQ